MSASGDQARAPPRAREDAIAGPGTVPAPDVLRLVCLAAECHGVFGELPFWEVEQGVAAWKPRRRHPRSAE